MTISKEQNLSIKIFSARDYIQDGLVCMLDGEVGPGFTRHKLSSRIVFDVTGNGTYVELADGVSLTGNSFKSFGTSRASVASLIYPSAALAELLDYNRITYTAEIAFRSLESSMNSTFLVCLYGKSAYNRLIGIGFDNSGSLMVGNPWTHRAASPIIQHPISFQSSTIFNQSAKKMQNFNNGILYNTQSLSETSDDLSQCSSWLFGDIGYSGFKHCEIYCFRVYNRALTMDEIAANYLVDKVRFGL